MGFIYFLIVLEYNHTRRLTARMSGYILDHSVLSLYSKH